MAKAKTFYHGYWSDGPQVRFQSAQRLPHTLPEEIAKLAHEEYSRHHDQSFEKLHERGGFSPCEVISLLADALRRERGLL